MSEPTVTHATFVIERTYATSPERVFAAWASREAKGRWFIGPDEWVASDLEVDFRVGGRESVSGGPKGGPVHRYDARYHDIVDNERIVITYDMYIDDRRMSVSLASVQIEPAGTSTKLTYTEHGAYLDGLDAAAAREEGTNGLLDQLGRELEQMPADTR